MAEGEGSQPGLPDPKAGTYPASMPGLSLLSPLPSMTLELRHHPYKVTGQVTQRRGPSTLLLLTCSSRGSERRWAHSLYGHGAAGAMLSPPLADLLNGHCNEMTWNRNSKDPLSPPSFPTLSPHEFSFVGSRQMRGGEGGDSPCLCFIWERKNQGEREAVAWGQTGT